MIVSNIHVSTKMSTLFERSTVAVARPVCIYHRNVLSSAARPYTYIQLVDRSRRCAARVYVHLIKASLSICQRCSFLLVSAVLAEACIYTYARGGISGPRSYCVFHSSPRRLRTYNNTSLFSPAMVLVVVDHRPLHLDIELLSPPAARQ